LRREYIKLRYTKNIKNPWDVNVNLTNEVVTLITTISVFPLTILPFKVVLLLVVFLSKKVTL